MNPDYNEIRQSFRHQKREASTSLQAVAQSSHDELDKIDQALSALKAQTSRLDELLEQVINSAPVTV